MQIESYYFAVALGKGIGMKCVTVSMISSSRQTEGNDDKTYQLVGVTHTLATITRVPLHICISSANNAKLPRTFIATPLGKRRTS